MQQHLVRWQQQYGPQGLAVIYIDDARRDPLPNAQRIASQVNFAWYHDTGGRWNSAVSIQAYPTAYLLTQASGYNVVWEGIPVFNPQATEQAIRRALGL